MCIPFQQRSRRDRGLMVLANLALVAGIALPHVIDSLSAVDKNWFDAARGLLIGISIGLNLFVIRFGQRRDPDAIAK